MAADTKILKTRLCLYLPVDLVEELRAQSRAEDRPLNYIVTRRLAGEG